MGAERSVQTLDSKLNSSTAFGSRTLAEFEKKMTEPLLKRKATGSNGANNKSPSSDQGLLSLPLDAHETILNQLSIDELLALEVTSVHFRAIVRYVVSKVSTVRLFRSSNKKLDYLAASTPNLKEFIADWIPPTAIIYFIRQHSRGNDIVVHTSTSPLLVRHIGQNLARLFLTEEIGTIGPGFFRPFSNLRDLDLYRADLNLQDFTLPSQIKTLRIQHVTKAGTVAVNFMSPSTLESLALVGCETAFLFPQVAQFQLRRLKLGEVRIDATALLPHLQTKLLARISIYGPNTTIPTQAVAELLGRLVLKNVHLSLDLEETKFSELVQRNSFAAVQRLSVSRLTHGEVINIPRCFPNINELKLELGGITDSTWPEFETLRHLQTLQVQEATNADCLAVLLRKLSTLRDCAINGGPQPGEVIELDFTAEMLSANCVASFHFTNAPNLRKCSVTNAALRFQPFSCPSLQSLTIWECNEIEENVLVSLINASPNLQRIFTVGGTLSLTWLQIVGKQAQRHIAAWCTHMDEDVQLDEVRARVDKYAEQNYRFYKKAMAPSPAFEWNKSADEKKLPRQFASFSLTTPSGKAQLVTDLISIFPRGKSIGPVGERWYNPVFGSVIHFECFKVE